MSYIAFATNRFDAVVGFYGETLGFGIVEQWGSSARTRPPL